MSAVYPFVRVTLVALTTVVCTSKWEKSKKIYLLGSSCSIVKENV